jgi:hypothetical protein
MEYLQLPYVVLVLIPIVAKFIICIAQGTMLMNKGSFLEWSSFKPNILERKKARNK